MIIDNKIIKLLFYILPFSLLTGPFLSDLIVTIIFLTLSYKIIENKKFILKNNFIIFFLIFYFFIIFSIVFISPAPIFVQGTSIFYIRFLIFCYALSYFFTVKKNIFNFSKFFFIIFVILILDSFIQFYLGKNLLGIKLVPSRVSSLFGDELIMGSFVSKILPINLIFISYLEIGKHKKFYLYIFTIIFSAILIFLSGERTALGMFLFQMILIFILFKYDFYKKLGILSFIFVLFSSTLFFSNLNFNNYTFLKKINQSVERFEHGFKNYLFFEENKIKIIPSHSGHYVTAYKIFKNNKIFGGGIKSFRYLCEEEKYKYNSNSCATHPHNTLLLFMSDLGLFGLFFYLFFIFFLIFEILKSYLNRNSNQFDIYHYNRFIFVGVGILSTVLPILPNGNFFNNYMSILFYILFGFYLHLRQKIKR